jgi:hypothetical protein
MISEDDQKNLKPETLALLKEHGDIPFTRDDLRAMEAEEVARLRKAGRLNHLLNPAEVEAAEAEATSEPAPPAGSIDQGARSSGQPKRGRASLRGLSPEEIVRGRRAGLLDPLMRGEVD